jgi:hypothetical protein
VRERILLQTKSIRDQSPLETGGTIARKGFIFQDHVAANFCLALVLDPDLKEVWCETQDDITLIWSNGQTEVGEFVQVKSNELAKLWSVADLCRRDGAPANERIGSSILEKSLANDRHREESLFRIVTLRSVNNELKILTYPKDSPARAPETDGMAALRAQIEDRLGGCCSPKKNGPPYWLRNVLWEVTGSETATKHANIVALRKVAESFGAILLSDQVEELYLKILKRAQDAACADWNVDRSRKKFVRSAFCDWIREAIQVVAHPASAGIGKRMRDKMRDAGLPEDYIKSAHVARRAYRRFLLHPTYQKSADLSQLESEIVSKLHHLRSQLDAGKLTNQGIQFHALCLSALEDIRANSSSEIPLSFFQGCMYNVTDRCLHRFRAVTA